MKRTKAEVIEMFKYYQNEWKKIAARTDDETERIVATEKASTYGMAAFELEHNME